MLRRTGRAIWVYLASRAGVRVTSCFLACSCMAGCTVDGSDVSPLGQVPIHSDSSGVRIVLTPSSIASRTLAWMVDTVPDLLLGASESPAEAFFRISGVQQLRDASLLIVDAGSKELRFFQPTGEPIGRSGGEGEGPGEFKDPVLLRWPNSDSILLLDRRLPRLQVYTPTGTFVRAVTFDRRLPSGQVPPIGAVSAAMLLLDERELFGGEAALSTEGMRKLLRRYSWYNVLDGTTVPLDTFVTDWNFRNKSGDFPAPFAPRPSAALGRNGAVISSGRSNEVRLYDVTGSLTKIYRVPDSCPGLTNDAVRILRTRQDVSRDVPVPDRMPCYDGLIVDTEGWVWARQYDIEEVSEATWQVFDADGVARGLVRMPPRLTVHEIGSDYILGTLQDQLGVEYVSRHRLTRRDPTTH